MICRLRFIPPAAALLAITLSISDAASFAPPGRTASEVERHARNLGRPPQSSSSSSSLNRRSPSLGTWAAATTQHSRRSPSNASSMRASPMPSTVGRGDSADEGGDDWTSLVGGGGGDAGASPVRKLVLVPGSGDVPSDGWTIEIGYAGTLHGNSADDWSVRDVAECWLPCIQGMAILAPKFVECGIDGRMLADLTEEYCTGTMGIESKMQAKKLVMASRRLAKQGVDHPPGTAFDSSDARGANYSFVLGRGRVVRAMDLALRSMRVGERSILVCRSDYGYGSEGLRTAGGVVVVPPFATLRFDLTLVGATAAASS